MRALSCFLWKLSIWRRYTMLEFLRASAWETGADLEMKVHRFCFNWSVVQNTRSVTGRQTGVDPWRIVTVRPFVSVWAFGRIVMAVSFHDRLSVRDGPRKYVWRCYGVWWKCGRIVPIGTDRDDPPQPWRMLSIRDRLSVCKSLGKYSKDREYAVKRNISISDDWLTLCTKRTQRPWRIFFL